MLVMFGGLVIGHAWTLHLVEPRGWSVAGLGRNAWRLAPVARGGALGALAIGVPAAVLLAVGWLRVEPAGPGSSLGAAAVAVGVLAPAAAWEELFVRGYAFGLLRERWGAWAAIVATSSVFGAMHLLNAGATALSVTVVMLGGVFLGLIRERTGSLVAAWAAHLTWNLVLVVALHARVSGLAMPAPDYRIVDSGPDWATGGAWGPEGGLGAALGLLVAISYVNRRWSRRAEPES